MKNLPDRLNIVELALVLNISEWTIKKLVKSEQIPFLRVKNKIIFDFTAVIEYLKSIEGGII